MHFDDASSSLDDDDVDAVMFQYDGSHINFVVAAVDIVVTVAVAVDSIDRMLVVDLETLIVRPNVDLVLKSSVEIVVDSAQPHCQA